MADAMLMPQDDDTIVEAFKVAGLLERRHRFV
jgi:hypothetical protein